MTTINVPGKITALEVDESGNFEIVSLTGGASGSPTTVSPSGEPVTIVLATAVPGPDVHFQMDASFSLGGVVEMYPATPSDSFVVTDENGIGLGSFGGSVGVRLRKILTGNPGVPTWGSVS